MLTMFSSGALSLLIAIICPVLLLSSTFSVSNLHGILGWNSRTVIAFELKIFIGSVVVNSLLCSFLNTEPGHTTFWFVLL